MSNEKVVFINRKLAEAELFMSSEFKKFGLTVIVVNIIFSLIMKFI